MFALPTRATIHRGFYGAGAEDEDQREAEEAAGARAQHGQGTDLTSSIIIIIL